MPPSAKNVLTNSFKTFEDLVTQWRMFAKMSVWILLALFALQCLVLFLMYKYHPQSFLKGLTSRDVCVLKTYATQDLRFRTMPFEKDFSFVFTCDGGKTPFRYSRFKAAFQDRYENYLLPTFKRNFLAAFLPTSGIYGCYFIVLIIFSRQHVENTKEKFIRGTVRKDQEEISRLLENFDNSYKFKLNEHISIPESLVTRHNFCIGKPGSGKSTLIFKIVDQLLKRDVKCIIHDYKGDFIPQFYDPSRHHIFNPLDVRHMSLKDDACTVKGWTIFNDLHTYPDIDAFAASLIPENKNSDPIWHTAPRDLLKSTLIYCIKNGLKTNHDLYETILQKPEKLKELFADIPECRIGLKHLDEQKLAGQFDSIIGTFTAPLQYLVGNDGNFSIEKWIADPNPEKKVIFISNQAKVRATLQKLIATFFDFSITSLNSLPDDRDRRIYFILDEFGRLGKMDSIVDLLTISRSKGGAAWLLIQDAHQIESTYGREYSKTIVNNCGNKFSFAVGDEATAEFISRELGTAEIERTRESKSFGVNDLRDSISLNSETVEKKIALSSEIMNQKSLSFFMKLTDLPLTHVEIEYTNYPYTSAPYEPRNLDVEKGEAAGITSPMTPPATLSIGPEAERGDPLFEEFASLAPDDEEIPADADEIADLSGGNYTPLTKELEQQLNEAQLAGTRNDETIYQETEIF